MDNAQTRQNIVNQSPVMSKPLLKKAFPRWRAWCMYMLVVTLHCKKVCCYLTTLFETDIVVDVGPGGCTCTHHGRGSHAAKD